MKKFYTNTTENSWHSEIKDLLLPKYGCTNRQLIVQKPEYIVIHEVSLGLGKSPKEYDMTHYANKILVDGLNGDRIGYHYLVGDKMIYRFIPDNEVACHTGTPFNFKSIGVERLICEGISYDDALHNQAKLVATLMVKWNIPLDNVITHLDTRRRSFIKDKVCPNRLIAGLYGGISGFMQEVLYCLNTKDLFYQILTPRNIIEQEILNNIALVEEKVRSKHR